MIQYQFRLTIILALELNIPFTKKISDVVISQDYINRIIAELNLSKYKPVSEYS